MRASDDIRAALQILQTSVRVPQNTQTAAEVHSLVAVETDEHEIARLKMQCASVKQAAAKFAPATSEVGERNDQGCCAGGRARTQWLAQCRHGGYWNN